MTEKRCPRCTVVKTLDNTAPSRTRVLDSYCRECRRILNRDQGRVAYAANPEAVRLRVRAGRLRRAARRLGL